MSSREIDHSRMPSKQQKEDVAGVDDPTELMEDGSMVEITIASPDNNDNNKEYYTSNIPSRKWYRYAKMLLVVTIVSAVVGGCVSVLVILTQRFPEEYVRPSSLDDGASNPPPPKEDDTSSPVLAGCTRDARRCPDGVTFVGRDINNNCEFRPCPVGGIANDHEEEEENVAVEEEPASTTTITSETPLQQQQEQEQEPTVCPRDIKMCTDLSTVSRIGPNCEFKACPAGSCMVDTKTCPDGTTTVGRDATNNCEFKECPIPTDDKESDTDPVNNDDEQQQQVVEESESGSPCPEGINPREIKLCPDFTTVTRSGPNCEFALCPP